MFKSVLGKSDIAARWIPLSSRGGSPPGSVASRGSVESTGRGPRAQMPSMDALSSLQRREAQLQRHLQMLLDAQARGLRRGLGGEDEPVETASDDAPGSSARTGSRSPPRVVPVRQPVESSMTLSEARSGIADTIADLSHVKAEQERLIWAASHDNEAALGRIASWEDKRGALNEQVESIHKSKDGDRSRELREEGRVLQEQINAVEAQLSELKSQHRAVYLELANLENSVQAKLSSYKGSLEILDKEISEFLKRPPRSAPSGRSSPAPQPSYLSLPPGRRTLQMAREHLDAEQDDLAQQRRRSEAERGALDEGAIVWADVVSDVQDFERHLQREIRSLDPSAKARAPRPPDAQGNPEGGGMGGVLAHMDQTLAGLESKLKLAEARGWNLLICSIGAELEAFRQGRGILEAALGAHGAAAAADAATATAAPAQPGERHAQPSPAADILQAGDPLHAGAPPRASGSRSATLSASCASRAAQRRSLDGLVGGRRRKHDDEDEDDDEPDPDLLVSRAETDTE